MTLKLFFLLYGTYIFAEIDRRDGAFNYFNVANNGRLDFHSVLMFLEDISLNSCINYCVKHLQCLSVSYSSTARLCELNDVEFDEIEADVNAVGWMNYGTQKVHGIYSDWIMKTPCSTTCENGVATYKRFCINPAPQNGGSPCKGPDEKTDTCFVPCPLGSNVALNKPTEQKSTYDGKSENEPHWAVDGDYSTRSVTSILNKAWWQVDLGEIIRIRLIIIHVPSYPFKNKKYKKVGVYTKTQEYLSWIVCKDLVKFPAMKVNVTCESRESETAQYVRVQEDELGTHVLYLGEVEVYKW